MHRARFDELSTEQLYAILRLRSAVFVVEQECAYLDLDERDRESQAIHWWTGDDAGVTAYVRLLAEPGGGSRLGRVVTDPRSRGRGLAAALIRAALADECAVRPVVLHAQAHLAGWYDGFGFRVTGETFDEDGIPHVPMTLR